MRRRSLMLAPALAVLVLAPTGVKAAPSDLIVCDAPPAGTTVLKPGEIKHFEPASPQLDPALFLDGGGTTTDLKFQLDLYPATATDTATVTSTLNWALEWNDWDLHLLDADDAPIDVSENFQFGPLEDPPTEDVSATLLHCSLFTVSVFNYQAVAADDVDPLQLDVGTGSVL